MTEAVIVSATRTPIGRARKGSLVDARPDDLVAFAIDAALKQVPLLDRSEIADVMVGCGFPQERQGMNLARRAALLAELPETVPGTTVNRFCASSLQTIRMAFHAIRAGEGDAYVAAGVESISQVDGYPKDAEELHPKLFGDDAPIANVYIPMGLTAENVAERWNVSREDMDRFAQQSQERAVAAQESGFFGREITPWDGVAKDDGPRAESTLEKLSQLEPAFKPDGKVTAGNSCPLNDGAAAVVVMSDTRARELGIAPRARIIASSVSGVAQPCSPASRRPCPARPSTASAPRACRRSAWRSTRFAPARATRTSLRASSRSRRSTGIRKTQRSCTPSCSAATRRSRTSTSRWA